MATTAARRSEPTRRDSPMQRDEKAIRNLIGKWMRATSAGDLDRVPALMADDVVFLVPGQPPLRGKKSSPTDFAWP
jgi:ketosteroid isomerase-like protein